MADENGSVDAGNPDAGTAAPGEGEAVATSWTDGFDEGAQSFVQTKGWQSPGDMLQSYQGLEKLVGNPDARLTVPGEDATDDDWSALYSKLGRPENKDGYEFAMPEGLPEDFNYSEDLRDGMRAWAHEAGLSPRQAQRLHDGYVKHMADVQSNRAAEMQQAHTEAVNNLKREWGGKYDQNVELAARAAETIGGNDMLGLLEAGLGNNPIMIKALAKVGEMLGEDSLVGGGDATISDARSEINRLSSDADFITKLTDRDHPGHDAAVKKWAELHERASF